MLVWHFTGHIDLFTPAMRSALFEIWRNAERFCVTEDLDSLYEIALNASYEIWRQQKVKNSAVQQSRQTSLLSMTGGRREGWNPRDSSFVG